MGLSLSSVSALEQGAAKQHGGVERIGILQRFDGAPESRLAFHDARQRIALEGLPEALSRLLVEHAPENEPFVSEVHLLHEGKATEHDALSDSVGARAEILAKALKAIRVEEGKLFA